MVDNTTEGESRAAVSKLLPVKPVDVISVEIRTPKSRIVIDRPEVMVMQVMDREVWQISGETHEHPIAAVGKESKAEGAAGKKESILGKIEELDYGVAKAMLELKEAKKK